MTAPITQPQTAALVDLAQFTRLMLDSGDLEPWAELLRHLYTGGTLDREQTIWMLTLYNTYDDLGQAWQVYRRWPSPRAWQLADDRRGVTGYMPAQERRNLRGGRVLRRFNSYVQLLDGGTQERWLRLGIGGTNPERDFVAMTRHLRQVWGVGRQAAFEWAEFLHKVVGFALTAPDAQLWESEGPRRALQRLYGNDNPSPQWLDARAVECRELLEQATGRVIPWEDFETVICDFNVMRDGRYYPGKHLAMLRGEIEDLPAGHRSDVLAAFRAVIPAPWRDIAPGVDKSKQVIYRDTGRMVSAP